MVMKVNKKKKGAKSEGKRQIKRPGITFTTAKLIVLTRNACERSDDLEYESIVAIILAAAAIESYFNESIGFAQMIVKKESEKEKVETVASILNVLERAPTTAKIEMAHFVFTGKRLDKSQAPFMHYALLRTIRNHLVHKKPEIFETVASKETEPHRFVKALADRGVIELPPPGFAPLWEKYVCVPQVAAWAHDVAVDMIKFIRNLYPSGIRGPAGVGLSAQVQVKLPKLFKPVAPSDSPGSS